jgi:nitrite reductase/ring-hydroxylating ferredoxin subunit
MSESRWRIAAAATTLRRAPLGVVVADTALVLFRDAGGRAAAMIDRCPHRGVPLSMGHCHKGRIVCPYHGWQFDAEGLCQLIPANLKPTPPQAMLQPIATLEQDGYVWVVSGEATAAPAPPPRLPLGVRLWRQCTRVVPRPARELEAALAGLGAGLDANGAYWWHDQADGQRIVTIMVIPETAARSRLEIMIGARTIWPFWRGRCRYEADLALPASLLAIVTPQGTTTCAKAL